MSAILPASADDGILTVMSGGPSGFDYHRRGTDIVVTHGGKTATLLRGDSAVRFLTDVESGDAQQVMARVTGNYKRGNERTARNHPRNR